MVEFDYVVKDKVGLHARPAGLIVKVATPFKCQITLKNKQSGKTSDAKKLFALMNLGVKFETPIGVICDGNDEIEALEKMKEVIETNL